MRQIKFRAWDKKLKKMFYQTGEWEIHFDELVFSFPSILKIKVPMSEGFGPYELMQYTGLKDKNGKETYEGDIVKYKNDDGNFYLEEVVLEGGGFYPVVEEKSEKQVEDFEVIGNIYENPELIKNKE